MVKIKQWESGTKLEHLQTDHPGYIFDNFAAPLYGYIRKVISDKKLANQVLEISLLKIVREIRYYKRENSRLLTWMLCIVRNIIVGHLTPAETCLPAEADKVIHELYVIRKFTPQEIAKLLRQPLTGVLDKINIINGAVVDDLVKRENRG